MKPRLSVKKKEGTNTEQKKVSKSGHCKGSRKAETEDENLLETEGTGAALRVPPCRPNYSIRRNTSQSEGFVWRQQAC